jgi:7-carboxy-7-deazaguanine synthase (Cx14CxxC type)
MTYQAKEIYYTLQGEGANTGRAAVFCRFAGCNLWSGREADRAQATCKFCDTDFIGTDGPGGGKFDTPAQLAAHVKQVWLTGACDERMPDSAIGMTPMQPHPAARPLVVCTGGEPLLQLDEPLIEAFHAQGFEVAVETNGTRPAPRGIDWVCVSPKAGSSVVLTQGDELKLVYPQPELLPHQVESWDFKHRYLQPMDGVNATYNTQAALAYCLAHPQWRLSVQVHKLLRIP